MKNMKLPRRFTSSFERLIALWILRTFSVGMARSAFLQEGSYTDPEIAEYLGLPRKPDEEVLRRMPQLLDELHSRVERAGPAALPARARANFDRLAAMFGLNSTETCLLKYFACIDAVSALRDSARVSSRIAESRGSTFYARLLDLPRRAVADALAANGRLFQCGILYLNDRAKPRFFSDDVATMLVSGVWNETKMLKEFGVSRPPKPELGLDDYPHLKAELDLLLPYLRVAHAGSRTGVNILLYGPPGTGKTQLARALGSAVNVSVREIGTTDQSGDPLDPQKRLNALSIAQEFFQSAPVMLVFDEAEDVFTPNENRRGVATSRKGWFNKQLEENRRPVIWISNSIETLDSAFARRFDFAIAVPVPPRAHRCQILRQEAGALVSPTLIERLAGVEVLAPAVVARAGKVISLIRKEIPAADRDDALIRVVGGVLKAQGHPDLVHCAPDPVPAGIYEVGYLNTSVDLARIADGLRARPEARICLHGPPGTGKTSFGHWLAAEVGQPLLVRKASDLLSPFMGETEKKIAETFQQARKEGAVLLIDEVDSFLAERSRAQRPWEVTQVNEMLTQIEAHPGILIASTNLVDQLDAASLRRFDLKLFFDYLLPAQTLRMFESHCRHLKLPRPTSAERERAGQLELAAPGDFAAAARRHRFDPFPDAGAFLSAIVEETANRGGRTRRIGFQ